MDNKVVITPAGKRAMTVLCSIFILFGVALLVVICISFISVQDIPEDAIEITCSFQSYEIKDRTKSSAYDVILYSDEYDLPFKFIFFDGYREKISPRQLCTGQVYSIVASLDGAHYRIYELSDGNLLLTQKEAHQKSQLGAGIASAVLLLASMAFFVTFIVVLHHPERFSERLKKFLFKPKRSI